MSGIQDVLEGYVHDTGLAQKYNKNLTVENSQPAFCSETMLTTLLQESAGNSVAKLYNKFKREFVLT